MNITIGMPVKGYLKHYLYWKENLAQGEVLDLNSQGEIPWVLRGLLTGKVQAYPHGAPEEMPEIYDAEIITKLTVQHFNRSLFCYSLDSIRYFNTYLYRDFHETLLNSILIMKKFGVNEVETIWKFIDMLDLHDQISFEALKKASYRLRTAKKIPLFRCANSNPA